MIWLAFSFIVACVAAWVATPWVKALAHRMNVLDRPDARKQHSMPTARLGGVGVVIPSLCVAWCLFVFNNHFSNDLPQTALPLLGLSLGVIAVFMLGVIDDIRNVNGKVKLLVLMLIATGVGMAGVRIPAFTLPWIGTIESLWITVPLSVIWLVSVCVAINFIDGIDGLATGLVTLAATAIAVLAAVSGQMFLAILACALAGASLGFLRFNWPLASVFLGDCGSMTLGFMLAALTMVLANRSSNPWVYLATILALAVPLLDTSLTFFRRAILERRSIFSAERGHIHHRLLNAGLRVPQVLRLLLGLTLLTGTAGILLAVEPSRWTMGLAGASLIPLVVVFRAAGSVRLREMIAAVRMSIRRSRENVKYTKAFEEMQVRFRAVDSFERWWDELCEAGRRLQITAIDLTCHNRDGTRRELNWTMSECDSRQHAVHLTLPVPQRRIDSPIECRLSVSRNGSLESVGYRMALFGRLLESHGLGKLPIDGPIRLQKQSSVLRLAGLSQRVASLQSATRPSRARASEPSPGEIDQPAHGGDAHRGDAQPVMLETPPAPIRKPRIAVVHDFLYIYGGAERVLENILAVYPEADLFSLFDFLDPQQREFIGDRPVRTSFIQRLPFARRYHRHYLALMPLAIEQLDMSGYDIVISSSYLAAKGIVTGPDQLHVCYCHTPARFAWDLQEQCLDEAGIKHGLKSAIARFVLHYIRAWDIRSAHGVDKFITNSDFVRRRVKKIYGRDATTIYPPVDVANFALCEEKDNFYVTASRLVPYKKIGLIADAFTKMPAKRLVIIGDGPEFEAIKARSGPNVILKGFLPKDQMIGYMQRAKAFVFTAIEDFGIVPVEAQACGTPIIALNRGGLCESVIDGETGILFDEQTPEAIIAAVQRFEARGDWNPIRIRMNAMKFSAGRFQIELSELIESVSETHFARRISAGGAGGSVAGEAESPQLKIVEERSTQVS